MNWIVWLLIGFGLVTTLLLATGWWRYAASAYLVVRANPYEQTGTGGGSILVIGDSTGYGTGANRSSETVVGRLGADFPSYAISNDSVNGRKIAGAKDAVKSLPVDSHYDLIVFQIGANDMLAGVSAEETVGRMEDLLYAAKPYADKIVVLTSGNIGGVSRFSGEKAEKMRQISAEYDQSMQVLASEHQDVSFISLYDDPKDDPFVANPEIYTAIDGLHPTSAGYAIWYQKAKPIFVAALEK